MCLVGIPRSARRAITGTVPGSNISCSGIDTGRPHRGYFLRTAPEGSDGTRNVLSTLLVLVIAPLGLAFFGVGAVGTAMTAFSGHIPGGTRLGLAVCLALGAALLVPAVRRAWTAPDD
jgi:hypothetical protein